MNMTKEQFDNIIINAIKEVDEEGMERILDKLQSVGMESKACAVLRMMWHMHNGTAAGKMVQDHIYNQVVERIANS